MTNEPQSVERLFEAALDLPPEERSGFLDRACAGAPMLRHLMEQLIEEEKLPDDFLRIPILQGQDLQGFSPNEPTTESIDSPPCFEAGNVIAGRFQVVRFIARGGMGEVYEVQDRFLQGTPVALKIIRPHIAADPRSSRRFEQEVLLARRVNHRNLCPIYDIFHCDQPAPPFLFLTMKLLAGESLYSRLKRHEAISPQHAVQICNQLVEGIEAIHRVGIIHRDIKPNNVMLESSGTELCVTIMDFGLARLSEGTATLTRAGQIAGTPGYLAPELVRGASPSVASDLYALGVVLHQVVTGDRPLTSKSGQAAIVSTSLQLSKAPAALVHAVSELLSEDPERRCQAFDRLVQAETTRSPLLTRRSFTIGGAAALSCLGAGVLWKRREIDDFFHPLPTKRFVALLNWPPPSDAKVTPMVLGLIDTMVNALSRAEAFDRNFYVACQNRLTDMKTPAEVNDVCDSLGANLILATSGSITAENIILNLKVIAKDSSKVLRSKTIHLQTVERFSLPHVATQAAAQLLNVSPLPPSDLPNQPGTKNAQALAAYQTAEAMLKEPNYSGLDKAIEQFRAAIELDPHFATAHARLSVAYFRHYIAHRDSASLTLAQANAETALDLDAESVEGHVALAFIYQATGAMPQALREIAKALSPDPSNPEIALYQAQIYFSLNRWRDAEDTFKRVLKARPNYWLAYHELGNTYSFQGKYRLALEAFQAASITSPRHAKAVANTALMLFLLGDFVQADAAIAKSLALAPNPLALQIRADMMLVRNKLTESLKAALQSIEMSPRDSGGWLRLADAYARMKHHDKDELEAYKRALAAASEDLRIDSNSGSSWMLMALFQCKLGDRTSAEASLKKAEDQDAVDIYSLMYKVRILELLERREEALITLANCLKMGATFTQIKSTNDLEALTHDPRYSNLIQAITVFPA